MSQRCVTLYGLMGAGKTAVGEALADILGYDFLDVDERIVEKAGRPITKIFADDGEEGFRRIEAEVVAGLEGALGQVIATGGGAVLDPANRRVFETIGLTVYLKATPRELYQRIKNDTSRPLLQNTEDPRKELERLLNEREKYYQSADIVVDTEDLSVEEVADLLVDELAKRTVGDI